MTLENCLVGIAKKDEIAFDNLYEDTRKVVFHIVYSVLKNIASTEDCMQEVYMTIYRKAEQYKRGTNAKAWIYTVAKHSAYNYYNKYSRESAVDFQSLADVLEAPREDINEDDGYVDIALKLLSQEDYNVLMMCEVGGYKRREVAEILNLPIPTVTWKRNNAIKVMREYLEGNK